MGNKTKTILFSVSSSHESKVPPVDGQLVLSVGLCSTCFVGRQEFRKSNFGQGGIVVQHLQLRARPHLLSQGTGEKAFQIFVENLI